MVDDLLVHDEMPHGLNTFLTMMFTTADVGIPGFTETCSKNIVCAKDVKNPKQGAYCQGRNSLVNTQWVFQGYGKVTQDENNNHYDKHDLNSI